MKTRIQGARRLTLSVVTVLALVGGLSGCHVVGRHPVSPDPSGPGSGSSDVDALDEQGIARILATREARFDFTAGAIHKSDVGLRDDEIPQGVSVPAGETLSLEVLGPDGTLHAETDRLRFFATSDSPDIDQITYFLTAADDPTLVALLRDGVTDYGIDSDTVERWIEGIDTFGPEGSDYAFPPGTSLGFEVIFDVRYDPSASTQVIIVQVLG